MSDRMGAARRLGAFAALMLVTVGWANALGKLGIRVNAIYPASTYPGRVKQSRALEAKD